MILLFLNTISSLPKVVNFFIFLKISRNFSSSSYLWYKQRLILSLSITFGLYNGNCQLSWIIFQYVFIFLFLCLFSILIFPTTCWYSSYLWYKTEVPTSASVFPHECNVQFFWIYFPVGLVDGLGLIRNLIWYHDNLIQLQNFGPVTR